MTDDSSNEAPCPEEPLENGARPIASGSAGDAHPTGAREKALVMTPFFGLILTLVIGFAVWWTLEAILPVFRLPPHLEGLSGNAPAAELAQQRKALEVARVRNASFSLIFLASNLAAVLTATELAFRRDPFRAVWGALVAGLVAGVIALGAGAVGAALFDALDFEGNLLVKTAIVQSAMLGVVGLGIGLGISLPMFRPRLFVTCVAGCLLGSLLAALLFPFLVGAFVPNVRTDFLTPEAGTGRLIWIVMVTGFIGVTVTGLGKERKHREPART